MGDRFKSKMIAVAKSRRAAAVKFRWIVVVKSGQAAGHMISEQVEAARSVFSKEWEQPPVVHQTT